MSVFFSIAGAIWTVCGIADTLLGKPETVWMMDFVLAFQMYILYNQYKDKA